MWKYQNLKFDKNTNIINKNVHTSVTTRPSPASRTVVEAFTSHRFTRQSIVAPTHFATAVAIVTRWAGRLAGVTLVARFTLTPAVLARQRRQCCYLTKARSTLATMSKQHCRSNRQQSCLLLRQCSVLGNIVEATFDFVERTKFQRKTCSTLLPFLATKSNVASTLLPKTATMSKQHSTL